MKEPIVSRILKSFLYIVFVLGIAGTVTLPFMLETYTGYFYDSFYLQPGYRSFIIPFLMSVAVLGLWIIAEMIWMLNSIPKGPFVIRNVRALGRIGVILLSLSLIFFLKCFMYATFLTMGCGFLFLIGGLFAFTLANLFSQAVAYKEENDLTI